MIARRNSGGEIYETFSKHGWPNSFSRRLDVDPIASKRNKIDVNGVFFCWANIDPF